jgi:mRNA interferase MazF
MARLTQVLRSATSSASPPHCPEAGDVIWLDFDPQRGREQAGRRMALVLSPEPYNRVTRLCVLCPITTQVKGYPFETGVPAGLTVQGVVLSDHVKNLSWSDRRSGFVCKMPAPVVADVLAKIQALLGLRP